MTGYKISGVKGRASYSFAFKSIHEEIREANRNGGKRGGIDDPKYDIENGVLVFSTDADINPFELKRVLAEKGLTLIVLEDK